jgi:hypothetical protein
MTGNVHDTEENSVPTMIFVNLPVQDLQRSKGFYTALGYGTNPQFSDENATNIVISDTIYLMLLVEPYFKTFTDKQVIDATTSIQTILALSADSREAVDALVDKALAAGGAAPKGPEDHGFMYQRSFTDPDGHLFEIIWMDPNAQPPT